jgi:hypothetical protein
MKTPHKLYLGLIICLIAMLIIGYIWSVEKDKQLHSLQQANGLLQNENTAFRTVNGKLISDNQAAELRVYELKESLPFLANALTKNLDIKMRDLRAGLVAEIQASGKGNAKIIRDTVRINGITITDSIMNNFEPFALTFDDGYLNFKSDVYSEYQAPSEYTYTDTLTFAFHMKREKWFNKKQLFVSGSLSNPTAKVLRSQGVLVNEFKQKRFGIGPYFGAGITSDLELRYSIGISLHMSLIRF